MATTVTQRLFSYLTDYSKNKKSRSEIISLAEVLRKANSQEIEVPDFSTKSLPKEKSKQVHDSSQDGV